jgi:hypothetical protein
VGEEIATPTYLRLLIVFGSYVIEMLISTVLYSHSSQISRMLPIVGIALLLIGCAVQSIPNQKSVPAPSAANASDSDGWYLIAPPQRAYASDRDPMMGGPLATSGVFEHRGASDAYSLTQIDTSAPLSKWMRVAGVFSSDADCEDFKAAEFKKISDPASVASAAKTAIAKNPHLVGVDVRGTREIYESERCVGASQLSSH